MPVSGSEAHSLRRLHVTPVALALALGGYALRTWAITGGYHRYFAHRSYKTSRAFQMVLGAAEPSGETNGHEAAGRREPQPK